MLLHALRIRPDGAKPPTAHQKSLGNVRRTYSQVGARALTRGPTHPSSHSEDRFRPKAIERELAEEPGSTLRAPSCIELSTRF